MKALYVLGLVLGFSLSAQAFTLTGSNPDLQGWEDRDVKLNVNLSNCPAGIDVAGLIEEAASVWNNIPTSNIKVSVGTTTTSTTFANPTTVYCETNFGAITGADQNYVPAAAAASAPAGTITAGLLYLNVSSGTANISAFDKTKLVIIVAHEIGHILGLGHSQVSNSLMYYSVTYKTTLGISQDDMDGMSYLYPKNELSGDKIMGCGLVQNLPPPPPGRMWLLGLFFFLPLMVYAALRRRDPVLS